MRITYTTKPSHEQNKAQPDIYVCAADEALVLFGAWFLQVDSVPHIVTSPFLHYPWPKSRSRGEHPPALMVEKSRAAPPSFSVVSPEPVDSGRCEGHHALSCLA